MELLLESGKNGAHVEANCSRLYPNRNCKCMRETCIFSTDVSDTGNMVVENMWWKIIPPGTRKKTFSQRREILYWISLLSPSKRAGFVNGTFVIISLLFTWIKENYIWSMSPERRIIFPDFSFRWPSSYVENSNILLPKKSAVWWYFYGNSAIQLPKTKI